MELYSYQNEIIKNIKQKMRVGHKHIIVQSPTGSGKTVMFCYIAKGVVAKGGKVLIVTDRIELLAQTGGTLEKFGLSPCKILGGQMAPPPTYHNCYIGMARTLANRIKPRRYKYEWGLFFKMFNLVIFDEAHKQEFNPFFVNGKDVFNNVHVLGFTATPQRGGKQRELAVDYSTMVEGAPIKELVLKGKLVPDKYFGVDGANVKGVKIDKKTGDYDENSLYSRFNNPVLYAGVVDAWLKHTPYTITICFCVNIKHTIETCIEFNKRGIKAKFLVSNPGMPKKLKENASSASVTRYSEKLKKYNFYKKYYDIYSGKRKKIIEEWKNKKFDVMINAGILTTGFDYKEIQTVIVNRATISLPLWMQMVGRGSRSAENKNYFNILDFGGHGGIDGGRLGNYMDEHNFSLTHKKMENSGVSPIKECGVQHRPGVKQNLTTGYTPDKNGKPGCGAYIPASATICKYCGYIFESEKEKIVAELKLMKYESNKAIDKMLESRVDQYISLERNAKSKGKKHGWIINVIYSKFGREGLKEYARMKGYSSAWVYKMSHRQKIN